VVNALILLFTLSLAQATVPFVVPEPGTLVRILGGIAMAGVLRAGRKLCRPSTTK
jgi:hypothetical protein